MTKVDLVSEICSLLRDAKARKPVPLPPQRYTITDDEGHKTSFSVKRKEKKALYTTRDISLIIDAMIDVLIDCIKRGEPVKIQRLGTFTTHFREARKTRIPGTRQWTDIPAHYTAKIDFARAMKEAALVYESYIKEEHPEKEPPKKRGRGRPKTVDLYDDPDDEIIDSETDDGSWSEVT